MVKALSLSLAILILFQKQKEPRSKVRTKILLWNFLENTNHKSPENHFFFLMYLDWSTHSLWSTSNPKIQVLLPRNTVIQEFLTSKEHVWWLQRTLSFSTALNSTFINKNYGTWLNYLFVKLFFLTDQTRLSNSSSALPFTCSYYLWSTRQEAWQGSAWYNPSTPDSLAE